MLASLVLKERRKTEVKDGQNVGSVEKKKEKVL